MVFLVVFNSLYTFIVDKEYSIEWCTTFYVLGYGSRGSLYNKNTFLPGNDFITTL